MRAQPASQLHAPEKVRITMEYSDKVMDHFMHPRNVGEIENADATGLVGNAKCGDIMKVYLKIENDIIVDAKFKTFGCGSAIATSSMATEMIKGKSIDEALALTNKAVAEALDGLPPIKMHCSLLAEQAVKAALKEYYVKNGLIHDGNKHLFDMLEDDVARPWWRRPLIDSPARSHAADSPL